MPVPRAAMTLLHFTFWPAPHTRLQPEKISRVKGICINNATTKNELELKL
jgi:hypothetical protein